MSCTVKKQETFSSLKELDTLNKMFDEVNIVEKEKYQVLTLRDKANKLNYDYIVWLELKISNDKFNGYSHTSKQDNLKRCLEKLVLWVDLIKNSESSSKPKQLSLFGDDEDEEEMPTGEDSWDKYNKECKKINIKNIKKKYSFFELFDPKHYTYKGIDYRKSLPSKEEIRELYKKAILDGKDKPSRYDHRSDWYWWDRPVYLADKDGLSDIELRDRMSSIRLFLVPYTEYFTAFIDNSFTDHSEDRTSKISYRYYLDGSRLSTYGAHDYDTHDLPKYENLFNLEFIDWVRNTLDVPYKEAISDKDILKENIESFFNSMLWYGKDDYNLLEKINSFTNWKQFKADILSFCESRGIDANGSGSGYSLDGFDGSYALDKKGSITINQRLEDRIELNRNIDGLERDDWRDNNYVVVYSLAGDEIYKKAFELLNKREVASQVSLFDFLAA